MFCLRTFKGFMNEIKGGEYFEFSCIFVGIFYCNSWCLSPCGRSVTSRPGRSTWSCPWTRPGCPGSHQHQRDSLHTHTTLYTTTAPHHTTTIILSWCRKYWKIVWWYQHGMLEIMWIKTTLITGCGCGSVSRAVASETRDPWFESNHLIGYLFTINCIKYLVKRPN